MICLRIFVSIKSSKMNNFVGIKIHHRFSNPDCAFMLEHLYLLVLLVFVGICLLSKIRFKKALENLEKKRKSARLGGLLAERPTSPIPTSYFADSMGPRVSSLSSTFLLPVRNRIGNRPLNPF